MGVRIRKSKNFGPLRVNLSKSGIGYSVGGKGVRFTKTAKGNTRKTYSIPGSGISYVEETSNNEKNPSNKKRNKKITNIIVAIVLFFIIVSFFGNSKDDKKEISSIQIDATSQTMDLNETLILDVVTEPSDTEEQEVKVIVDNGNNLISGEYEKNKLTIKSYLVSGEASVYLQIKDIKSNKVDIQIVDNSINENNSSNEDKDNIVESPSSQDNQSQHEQNSSESNNNESQSVTPPASNTSPSNNDNSSQSSNNQVERTVYITNNGSKYHSNPNCGNIKNPIKISLSEAESQGYEPCKKCF